MNDLISRQAAIKEAYKIVIDGDAYEVVQTETLMGLPSADAAEVVRCKTCDWYDISDELCLREGMPMDEEDYCSYGVRKHDRHE